MCQQLSVMFPKISWLQIIRGPTLHEGHPTELLLVHLSENWRTCVCTAIDANKVVAVAFVDLRKAFDGVSHVI